MTEKRYYKKEYEEEYYIFDSNTLTEKEFEEKVEYDGYSVFADSLTPEEVLDLLNENEELKKRLSDLQKENYGNIDGIAFYQEENASLCEKISDLKYENEELKKENNQLQRYVYHCPQTCTIILAYLKKCGSENVKAVNKAIDKNEYFDEEVDTLRL